MKTTKKEGWKEVYITDEEIIRGKNQIDLFEDGDFTVEKAFIDPKTFDFRLIGTWTKYPDENGNRKEVKGEIEGRLNPKEFDPANPFHRELEMTLSDIVDVEWLDWEISEI